MCLPYAGGSALIFRHWRRWLSPEVGVLPLELPGRGGRLRIAPLDRMEPLVEVLLADLAALSSDHYALFGHGTGALVAYELCLRLTGEGRPPRHLLVAASRPPDGDALEGSAAGPEDADAATAALQADRRLAGAYRREAVPLECPITVFGGVDDASVAHDALDGWSGHTVHPCTPRLLPGGHLFIHEHERLLTASVRRILCGASLPAPQRNRPEPAVHLPSGR